MSIHSKSEFAVLCGIQGKHVSVFIKRGKILARDDGKIDDSDPTNKAFKEARAGRAGKPTTASKDPRPSVVKDKPGKEPRPPDLYDLERESKTMQIEAKKKEIALTDARIARMHGQLMPTDVVNTLFALHFREVNMQFKQGIDGILSEFGKKLHANGNQIAEMRGIMVKILNDAVKKSVNNSKKHVENVLKELSQVKK